jgi:hypothetical protein
MVTLKLLLIQQLQNVHSYPINIIIYIKEEKIVFDDIIFNEQTDEIK